MKANRISDATKILLLAATTIITCVIASLGMIGMRSAKELNKTAMAQMRDLNNSLKDSELKKYDGLEVTGSDVINCIKKYLGDYVSGETAPLYIYVKTKLTENTYTNGSQIKNIQNFTHTYYIKPTALFTGEVVKNENDVILGIRFTNK
ncbi:MAG: hypothetical protein GX288_01930 [Clostridiales bacterium]|nr:hypothetical protein [Clostridiales bacterium]